MTLSLTSRKQLADGNSIPILGFGTYELEGKSLEEAIPWALEAGYRHFDSAEWYENEAAVCQAIKTWIDNPANNCTRQNIFYTTKLKHNGGFKAVKKSIETSIKCAAPLGYIDLYLIHGPWGGPQMRKEAWNAICDFQAGSYQGQSGKTLLRSSGVSTYGLKHLREFEDMVFDHGILKGQKSPFPVIHQIDLHPFMARSRIVAYCDDEPLPPPTKDELAKEGNITDPPFIKRNHKIALEAWAPLARGLLFTTPANATQEEAEDAALLDQLSKKYAKSPAQIMLRFSLQKGYIAIPKSANQTRIIANSQIFDFELTEVEMKALYARDRYLLTDWDPTSDP